MPPFLVQWSAATIFSKTNLAAFTWTNYQFSVTEFDKSTTLEFGNRNDSGLFGLDSITVTPLPTAANTAPILSATLVSTPSNPPSLQLSWTAVPGSTFQIQSTADMSKRLSWTPVGAFITVSTTNVTVSTPATAGSAQFDRLELLP